MPQYVGQYTVKASAEQEMKTANNTPPFTCPLTGQTCHVTCVCFVRFSIARVDSKYTQSEEEEYRVVGGCNNKMFFREEDLF